MKLFYIINEPFEGYQTGYRKALNSLILGKIIEVIYYYSFIPKEQELGDWKNVIIDIKTKIIGFKPDIILVAHLSKHHLIPRSFIVEINNLLKYNLSWVYDERDVYGFFRKPLSKNILNFASQCDLVTLCTNGKMMDRFKKAGAKNVMYLPQVYDANFGTEWTPTKKREYDIIMIANRWPSRIPFKSMPGIKQREKIVLKFADKFGERFAVFGKGWEKFPSNKGSINFFDQEKVIRKSWLTIGMDHFYDYNGYYSDRLPIALVSGVPHLTHNTPGLDKLFYHGEHVFYYKNPQEALELALFLLQKPKEELILFGQSVRSYVLDRFSEVERYRKIIELTKIKLKI